MIEAADVRGRQEGLEHNWGCQEVREHARGRQTDREHIRVRPRRSYLKKVLYFRSV